MVVKTNTKEAELILIGAAELPLDALLKELLAHVVPPKYFKALKRRLGWDGRGGVTLKEAAALSAVTRERIRQVEETTKTELKVVTNFPALDRAITVLDRAAANLDFNAHVTLQRERITAKPFLPQGVITAAEAFSKSRRFEIGPGPSAIHLPGIGASQFSLALRSLSTLDYVVSVESLHSKVQDLVGEPVLIASTQHWIEDSNRVEWLDDDHRWFLLSKRGRLRYFPILRKILSISHAISSRSLQNGAQRFLRFRGRSTSIPLGVFENLCRTAGLHVEDGVVNSPTPIDPNEALSDIEQTMYQILKEYDEVITRKEFRARCIVKGINHNSFSVHLNYSPIFERISPGVYSLRGAQVDPAPGEFLTGSNSPNTEG